MVSDDASLECTRDRSDATQPSTRARTTGDVTKRLFSAGRARHAYNSRVHVFPLLVALTLMVSIVFLMEMSLPAIKGPGFDYTDYYRECSAAMVVLPRALPIGLVAGVLTFCVALHLGEHRGRLFGTSILGLFGAATVISLAFLFGNGPPSPSYSGSEAADIFLVAVLPIGVPVVIGAVLGGRVAAVS
jgi:hypothetical protein